MYQINSKDLLMDNNSFISEKIRNLEESIRNLQKQGSSVEILPISNDDSYGEEQIRCDNFNDGDGESYSDLNYRFLATKDLTEIKFKNFTSKNLPAQEGLPPGLYREVETDVVFHDYLEASISFVEDINDTSKRVLFMKWSVSESVALTELASLPGVIKNDLPSLFARLREYSQMAQDRFELLSEFCHKFEGYCLLQNKEKGITLKWRGGLFTLIWNLQLSKYNEIVPVFIVYINEREVEFIRESSSILEELTKPTQTTPERRNTLMEFGNCALSCQN